MKSSIDDRVEQLRRYMARGWALTPLHDVASGVCSCRDGAGCRSAGKHPRVWGKDAAWQRPENLVRSEEGLRAALERWPSCNWGLATGLISGVWVLDWDPKNADPARQAETEAVLAACWATATWVQRTGSGGLHFMFALPEDFVPNNSSGRLPPGFDVRGARRGEFGGGQIVVAPSVTDKGPYAVLQDRPAQSAPALVLESVRPAAPRRVAGAQPLALATRDQNDATRYVIAGISGELEELRRCATQRNQRAWRAAARCIEMINTGLIGAESVYAAWWAAAAAHPDRTVTVPDRELLSVWASAERHVGDRPADLTGVGGPASWMGGDPIHFTPAPGAVPMLGGGPGAATGSFNGALHQGVASGDDGVALQVKGVTYPVASDFEDDPVTAMMARLLTPEQLDARPNPVPLINGVLDLATSAWIIGAAGSYKSFVALDFAAHVGRGDSWRGRSVRQGLVIYVVAEGDQGMKLRQAAWRNEYGPMKDVLFLPEPVQADERRGPGAWSVLVEVCARLSPALVIIDTQARVTIGLNENDNGEMSYYADQADRIKRACGACVLTVHHLGRKGSDARGASAIDGAQDAELRVVKSGMSLTLSMDKQKDQQESPPITIKVRRVEGGTDPDTGRDLSSLVLDRDEVPRPAEVETAFTKAEIGRRRALALYQVIDAHRNAGGEGLLRAEIRRLFMDLPEIAAQPSQSQRSAWHRAWGLLVSRGRVMREGSSQRLAVFPPPDGAADGLLTVNTGGPEDAPPEGWAILGPEAERAQPVDNSVDSD